MEDRFVCLECCEKVDEEYKNIGAYGPCDNCREITGITLVNVKKFDQIKAKSGVVKK